MEAWVWVFAGALAGWVAGMLTRGRSYGVLGNVILGLLGALVGGWLMRLLGGGAPETWWQRTLVAALGAVVVLEVARRLQPRTGESARPGDTPVLDLEAQISRLSHFERRIVERLLQRQKPPDPNQSFDEQLTFGQKVADQVAAFGGSWTFIGLFLAFMLAWMILNTQAAHPIDVFPFILLNLMLSCLAALQAPVIMMSQNRQAAKDRSDAKLDYEVNLRAEANIARVLETIEQREAEIRELIEINKRQLALIEGKMGPPSATGGPGA